MKKKFKIIKIAMIIIILLQINSLVYATGRFVDIPVPPNNIGNGGISSEDAQKKAEEYKKEQEESAKTADDFVGKSNNNNLKKLEVEGYKLNPKFSSDINDYELKLDKNKVKKVNIIAETDDEKATVDVNGEIEISNDIININVIAENGNLNVYTIKIIDKNQPKDENAIETSAVLEEIKENKINIAIIALIAIFMVIIIIRLAKYKKKGKHNK